MKKTTQRVNASCPPKGRRRFRVVKMVLLLTLGIIFMSSGWELYQLHTQVNEKIARLNQEKELLLKEKKQLEDEIVELNTPSYIEQLAREQLGLVRKGEIRIAPKE